MENNQALSQIFDHMADLYLLGAKAADRYRISSYRRVAQTLQYLTKDVEEINREGRLQDIGGIGEAISLKIQEYLSTGKIRTYEKLKARFPKTLLGLMDLPSLGPKKVSLIWHELKITDRKSLIKAIKDGSVEELPGFGKKSVANILEGIEIADALKKRKPYASMVPVVEMMKKYIKKSKLTSKLDVAGSFRRKKESIGDIDLLAISKKPTELINYFVTHPDTKKILAEGVTKGSIILKDGQQIDLRVVQADEWGAAMQYFTGSKEHNVRLRGIAKSKGFLINEYGLFKLNKKGEKGTKVAGKSEKEIYEKLGFKYIAPEKRLNRGELNLS